jgi:hypothetical protein
MELENVERRVSAGTTAPLPVDDENYDAIELEDLDKEEQGGS